MRLCWNFQKHFLNFCYKELVSINSRSVNSTATKLNLLQVISKKGECEIDKNELIKVSTPNLVLYWNLYFELWTQLLAFLSAFIANLEQIFVYQYSGIDLDNLFPEIEYVFICL